MNVRHSKHHGRCVEKIQHYLTGVKERTERTGIGNFQYNIQWFKNNSRTDERHVFSFQVECTES